MQFPALGMFQSSLSFLLERTDKIPALPSNQHYPTNQNLIANRTYTQTQLPNSAANYGTSNSSSTGEVSIQIMETGESDQLRQRRNKQDGGTLNSETDANNGDTTDEGIALVSSAVLSPPSHSDRGRLVGDDAWGGQDSSSQGIEILPIVRWIDQILPFLLLLLIVFIRQHLQGFVVAIGIIVVLFKLNDILQRQTALKGDRKISVLALICMVAMLYVVGFYCWHINDDLLLPLIMLSPKVVPQFWHAIFIVMAAMAFKCLLLMCYKKGSNRNYRWQVNAAGEHCAICQEKMHAPILLCCKHIFCEECVSEWFEREGACPLCRAVAKLAVLRSFADGSTSVFLQLF